MRLALSARNRFIPPGARRWGFRDGRRAFAVKVEGRCDANDDLMLQALACAGQGIAYLPAYLVQGEMSEGKLVALLTNYLPEALPVSIVYPSRRFLGKAKRALIDHLIGHAERHPFSDLN